MKQNCEVCGHELGFFERSLNIENTKLGLSHETLCSACHRSILLAIDKVEAISRAIVTELGSKLSKYRYASGNINVLIFLAVKEIYELEPDFDNPKGLLIQTFFPEEEKTVHTKFEYLILLTYKVLRYGFSPVLGRYGLDSLEQFIGYMSRECYFIEQVLTNCAPNGAMTYTDLFMSEAGLVFFDTENEIVRTLFISRDRTLRYEESHKKGTYDVTILRQKFHKLKNKPTICFNRTDQRREFVEKINSYNEKKQERIEGELTNLINNLNITIEKDLRDLYPDESLAEMPFDSVLVSTIKTLFDEDIEQEYVSEAPDGLLNLIIERGYTDNLEASEIEDLDGIQEYITDKCLFITDFNAAFGNAPLKPSFAFLTPRAYMIRSLDGKDAYLSAKTKLPNDLYTDYQYMIFRGEQEFYITTASSEKTDDGYYLISGVRIHAKDEAPLEQLEDYFSEKALDYYRDELSKELSKEDSLREQEIHDAARRIFVGFGYLPFCIYDEWAEIERILREGDLMMQDLITKREPKTGTGNEKIFYAAKTVNSFEQEAARLAESFEIKKLPVARGLLWGALKEEILTVCAEEFIRLNGDILDEDDDLENAFLKYSALSEIQPEKAYYLGLFIYYLMYKGLLERSDFLDHYDTAVKMYIRLNPNHIKQIEFSELDEPKKRAFDTEVIDFSSFKVDNEEENTPEEDSFIYSVREQQGDSDSIDRMIDDLNATLETEESLKEEPLGGEVSVVEDFKIKREDLGLKKETQNKSEKEEKVVINVEDLQNGDKRVGFDSVREIIGLTRKKR